MLHVVHKIYMMKIYKLNLDLGHLIYLFFIIYWKD